MDRKKQVVLGSISFIVILILSLSVYIFTNYEPNPTETPRLKISNRRTAVGTAEIKQFATEDDFLSYIERMENSYYSSRGGRDFIGNQWLETPSIDMAPGFDGRTDSVAPPGPTLSPAPDRYSQTNTQVLSIDEADIVKSNGQNIFYSVQRYSWYTPGTPQPVPEQDMWRNSPTSDSIMPEYKYDNKTYIINALPIEELSIKNEIEEAGKLYLHNDILIIEQNHKYQAYDISNIEKVETLWSYKLDEETSVISSRMMNGELFIIAGKYINSFTPCDMPILRDGEDNISLTVRCTDIYYPDSLLPAPQDITIIKINVNDGGLKDSVSFLGDAWNTIVYMSEGNIYVTFPQDEDYFQIMFDFISKNRDLYPDNLFNRVERLGTYDISSETKMIELEKLVVEYKRTLSGDDALQMENELQNRFSRYVEENVRSFSGTGIVKINSNNLSIEAVGKVQGKLLNQFSLDEYDGFLRVATTTDGAFWSSQFSANIEQANDIVVMGPDLAIVGEVNNLGITERIYSARFIGKVGYIVTFRQIDPFYIIDLSDPTNPEMKGELKIPGYSSYLHPLSDRTILGVGMEDGLVKLSLFDVSDPTRPIEASKYSLSDYWSEIESNHHAFLLDKKHEVFFIPGSRGGYIFSYENNRISLVRSISSFENVRRAMYIDDNMYIFSDNKVTVLDELTWNIIGTLDLK